MMSRTEHRKIVVQTRHENTKIESLPSAFRSSLGLFIRLRETRQKRTFDYGLCFCLTIEIIKMQAARKVTSKFVLGNNLIIK